MAIDIDRETGMEHWGTIYGKDMYRQTQTNDFFEKTSVGYVRRELIKLRK